MAQRSSDFAFYSLAHYIDLQWLEEAYHRTRKDGSVGVDDVTGKVYAENLQDNIRQFFDCIDHAHLREFVSRRVCDGALRRLIGKWLKAGVMENGNLSFSETGTPQGGVISPILANIYLHYVLDEWFEQTVKPLIRGKCHLIRFADDFVIIFQLKGDADRVMNVISKRFEKYTVLHCIPIRRNCSISGLPTILNVAGKKNRTATEKISGDGKRLTCWASHTIGVNPEMAAGQ